MDVSIWKENQRVHWFEYYRDGIISNGGFGTIVDIEIAKTPLRRNTRDIILVVLCDDGQLKKFPSHDVEIEEEYVYDYK